MQAPRIVELSAKILVGQSMRMTIATNHLTGQLWRGFIPKIQGIKNLVSQDKYAVQIYNEGFDWFKPSLDTQFTKWAAMEVSAEDHVPDGLHTLKLDGGIYGVFIHTGLPDQFPETLKYILNIWLPSSGFEPDYSRPQFELLGDKYINNHPDSEEEIWFPLKQKSL